MKITNSIGATTVTVTPATILSKRGSGASLRFGVGEVVNLAVRGVASVVAKASTWKLVSGATLGLTPNGSSATFTCPDVPKFSKDVEVVIQYGNFVEIRFDVIPPSTGKTKVERKIHKIPQRDAPQKPNAGYFGHMIVGPDDVSFLAIEIKEGGGKNVATGVLRDFDGNIHPAGNGWASPTPPVTTAGTVFAWDEVFTPANGIPNGGWSANAPDEVVGTSVTPIDWLYRLRGSNDGGTTFAKVKHVAKVTKSGRMTVQKGDAEVTQDLASPDEYKHPLDGRLNVRKYL